MVEPDMEKKKNNKKNMYDACEAIVDHGHHTVAW